MKKFSWYNAATAASVLLVVLVVLAELVKPFKAAITAVFSHHWIAKIVLITLAFVAVGFVYNKERVFGMKSAELAWYAVLASMTILFLFFLVHYMFL